MADFRQVPLSGYAKLGLLLYSKGIVLCRAKGMKRYNMGHAPVILGPVPHSAGQPVVTVYEVILDAFALSKYFQLSKKISQIGIDGQFIHRSVISGS